VSPPARRLVPLRVLIGVLFVALLALAGLAIVGYGYVATSRLLLSASEETFEHVAERTADRMRALLAPARLLVGLLASHRLTRATTLEARLEAVPFLAAALAEHAQISAIYVGYDDGQFFLLRPLRDRPSALRLGAPPGAAFLVQTPGAPGGAPGRFLWLDDRLDVRQDEPRPEYRFDPRTRDWYRQAQGSRTSIRTDPYVFFTTREVGTTLAQRSADGHAVVGADITLRELSHHLAEARVTPASRIALVDHQGRLVAHPDLERVVRPELGDTARLLPLDVLDDPVLERLFAGAARGGRVSLEVAGRSWVGVAASVGADLGRPVTLLLAAPREELLAEAHGLVRRQVLIGFGVLALAIPVVLVLARRLSRPLEALVGSVESIGRGDLDTGLPPVTNPAEVVALSDATDRMRIQLKIHIEERAARLAEETRRAQELEIARQIQRSMLPPTPREPLDGVFLVAAALHPAREVGGDLYDFFLTESGLLFAIGDVSDKGIPAALLMARTTGLLRTLGAGGMAPDQLLHQLDVRLSQGNEACMFVTAGCGLLDGETGTLRYASAGHEAPLLRRRDGSTVALESAGGPALGLGADFGAGGGMPAPWSGRLDPGDALVLYTDGVTEAFDAAGEAFGHERLRRAVEAVPIEALGTLPERVAEAVDRFAAGGLARDDLAVLVIQYRPPASP
jgi:sigma-B regulation protein RsbU (phosphoserine phosphatase)